MDQIEPNNDLLVTSTLPKRCEIELSTACNLHCTYCPRHYLDEMGLFMDFDLFKEIIDELSVNPDTILVLHRRGESLLHPRFVDCLDYIEGKFHDIQLATNATQLHGEKAAKIIETLSFISFSIDTPQNFNSTRIPAVYAEVEKNILGFLDMNQGKVKTQVSMVQTLSTTPEDIELFKRIWSDRVDRVRIYEEHSADGAFGSLRTERKERVPCSMPFYEILVYADGKVGRCNHDWDGSPMGDLNCSTIREIWHSAPYEELRRQHLTLDLHDEVCSRCDCWYPMPGHQMTGEIHESKP